MSETEFSPVLKTRSAIGDVPIKHGQLLVSSDTGEAFIDANNTRSQIGNIVTVDSEAMLPPIPVDMIYFSKADRCFFLPLYTSGELNWFKFGDAQRVIDAQGTASAALIVAQEHEQETIRDTFTTEQLTEDGCIDFYATKGIPLYVEINDYLYQIREMQKVIAFKNYRIPVDKILQDAGIQTYTGTWKVIYYGY